MKFLCQLTASLIFQEIAFIGFMSIVEESPRIAWMIASIAGIMAIALIQSIGHYFDSKYKNRQ